MCSLRFLRLAPKRDSQATRPALQKLRTAFLEYQAHTSTLWSQAEGGSNGHGTISFQCA